MPIFFNNETHARFFFVYSYTMWIDSCVHREDYCCQRCEQNNHLVHVNSSRLNVEPLTIFSLYMYFFLD